MRFSPWDVWFGDFSLFFTGDFFPQNLQQYGGYRGLTGQWTWLRILPTKKTDPQAGSFKSI